jgi:hypothetical protein
MKTRSISLIFIFSLFFLFKGTLMAQGVDEIFNNAFPELNDGSLFDDKVATLSSEEKKKYVTLMKKLEDASSDIEAKKIDVLTPDNAKVFEYKPMKKVKKQEDLDSLEKLIKKYKEKIRVYTGDKTKFGVPENECKTNVALLQQTTKAEKWKQAYPYWNTLFHYYPRSSRTIYSKGTDIIEYFYEQAKDEATKEKWVDTLMLLYDKRIKFFGTNEQYPRGYILGRKATDLVKYRPTAIEDAYKMIKESVKLQGIKSEDAVLVTFMQITKGMFEDGEKVNVGEVVDNFGKISGLLEQKIKDGDGTDNTQKALDGVVYLFSKTEGASDCNALVPFYQKKFEEHKNDAEQLKKIAGMLDDKECTDSELFFNVAIQLDKLNPSPMSKYALSIRYIKNGEYDKASDYLNEAIKLETEDTLKAKYYYRLAQVNEKMGKKSVAKAHALKAVSLKKNFGAPYILIATMYASSGCSQLTSPEGELHRIGYWAAVDKLVQARSIDPSVKKAANQLIGRYSGGFPNAEKAFMIGVTKGKRVSIGCWINESTTARF